MRVGVVGAGVIGLATTAALLERGADVVCFERSGAAMQERSAGSSRIFRLAHMTPELVALAREARDRFRRWEERAGVAMVGAGGCVVSGPEVAGRASAMEAAGAPCEIVAAGSQRLRLPALRPPSVALLDPSGGVIDVDAVRAYLVALTRDVVVHQPVDAIEEHPSGTTVRSATGTRTRFDVVVVAAGAGTSALAAQVGIPTPRTLAHHVRFTFPIDPSTDWPCWIDAPPAGLATYQHRSGPGRWSVGGEVDPELTAWDVGREAATAASRDAVLAYVREHLTVEPRIVESLYCAPNPGLGDGFEVLRRGAVLVVHGENLFKLAPVIGEVMARACLDGSTPAGVAER